MLEPAAFDRTPSTLVELVHDTRGNERSAVFFTLVKNGLTVSQGAETLAKGCPVHRA